MASVPRPSDGFRLPTAGTFAGGEERRKCKTPLEAVIARRLSCRAGADEAVDVNDVKSTLAAPGGNENPTGGAPRARPREPDRGLCKSTTGGLPKERRGEGPIPIENSWEIC